MTHKPYVQITFRKLNSDLVNMLAEEKVEELLKEGYRNIKVTVHEQVQYSNPNSQTSVEYSTTIQASISDFVHLG